MAHSTSDVRREKYSDATLLEQLEQHPMKCHRCEGFLSREYCFDLQDGTGENGFWGLRCLQCGEMLDPLIIQNRQAQHPVVLKDRGRRTEGIATSKPKIS